MKTIRLTMAQALARFLARQMTDIEGEKVPLFGGVWAIFGHGNVAGIGEALYQVRDELPTFRAHNEQAMAHAAIAYGKANFRRRRSHARYGRQRPPERAVAASESAARPTTPTGPTSSCGSISNRCCRRRNRRPRRTPPLSLR